MCKKQAAAGSKRGRTTMSTVGAINSKQRKAAADSRQRQPTTQQATKGRQLYSHHNVHGGGVGAGPRRHLPAQRRAVRQRERGRERDAAAAGWRGSRWARSAGLGWQSLPWQQPGSCSRWSPPLAPPPLPLLSSTVGQQQAVRSPVLLSKQHRVAKHASALPHPESRTSAARLGSSRRRQSAAPSTCAHCHTCAAPAHARQ